jgi:hypothetical protein
MNDIYIEKVESGPSLAKGKTCPDPEPKPTLDPNSFSGSTEPYRCRA